MVQICGDESFRYSTQFSSKLEKCQKSGYFNFEMSLLNYFQKNELYNIANF